MFAKPEELKLYIANNYPEVTDHRLDESHWDLQCSRCKITRGFQLTKRTISGEKTQYATLRQDFNAPITYLFRCPVCESFKQWIVYEPSFLQEGKWITRYFRVTSVPSEGLEEIAELPENPPALRTSYREAIRSMDANANVAAAIMFRRAVQVITRDILGVKSRSGLAAELEEVVGKSYNGAVVTANFASIGYIVKVAGDQAAHPDKEPDLLDFTAQDAVDLQTIFMELVSELFVIPAATRKAKEDFMARRQITAKPTKAAATKPAPEAALPHVEPF